MAVLSTRSGQMGSSRLSLRLADFILPCAEFISGQAEPRAGRFIKGLRRSAMRRMGEFAPGSDRSLNQVAILSKPMAVLSRPAILSKQIAVLSKLMAVLCLMSSCKEACLQAAIAALSSSPNGRFASKAQLKHVTRACLDKVHKEP